MDRLRRLRGLFDVLCWPILTNLYALVAPRPETAETEYDRAG